MLSRIPDRGSRILACFLCAALLLTLSPQVPAQQLSPALLEAARQAYQQGQQRQPEILAPAQVQSQVPLASETDWNNLSQLPVGARIVVETMDNVRHHGKFIAYSDEAISLREGKHVVSYQAEEVLAVWLVGQPNRAKAAELGFLIGFFGGAGVMGLYFLADKDVDLLPAGKVLYSLGFGAITGALGAGIGAAVALPAKTMIYRAPPTVTAPTGTVRRVTQAGARPACLPALMGPAMTGSRAR